MYVIVEGHSYVVSMESPVAQMNACKCNLLSQVHVATVYTITFSVGVACSGSPHMS